MHAFVVLAGATATTAGVPTAAGSCSTRRSPSGRTGSGTTPPAWRSSSGTPRWTTCSSLPRRQRQHARRRGDARRRRRPRRGGRRAGRPAARAGAADDRARGARLGPASATGGCPSTSPPTGRRCPSYNRDRPADPFRPYGVTVGHQFEWSRLALHVRAASPPSRRPGCSTTPPALFAAAARARLGGRRARRLPLHAGLGRPAGRRRPHALGALRGDRGGDVLARGHRRAALPRPGRAGGGRTASGVPRPGHRQLAPRADPGRRGRLRHLGRRSPTPTTWPRCCCSTAARCAAAWPPPCADRGWGRPSRLRGGVCRRRRPG